MTPKSKLQTAVEVKPPIEYPEIAKLDVEAAVIKARAILDYWYRQNMHSESLAVMSRMATLLTEIGPVAPVPEDHTLLEVPNKHLEAVKATLSYLVAAG